MRTHTASHKALKVLLSLRKQHSKSIKTTRALKKLSDYSGSSKPFYCCPTVDTYERHSDVRARNSRTLIDRSIPPIRKNRSRRTETQQRRVLSYDAVFAKKPYPKGSIGAKVHTRKKNFPKTKYKTRPKGKSKTFRKFSLPNNRQAKRAERLRSGRFSTYSTFQISLETLTVCEYFLKNFHSKQVKQPPKARYRQSINAKRGLFSESPRYIRRERTAENG